jgi:formylglycine-generating enzyme required for sulfatase activity
MQYAFEGDAVDGEGVRSVFTSVLVKGLETGEADLDRDGNVTLDELYDYAYYRIVDETPQQRPGKWTFDVQGDIIVAHNSYPVVKPAELPSDRMIWPKDGKEMARVPAGVFLYGDDKQGVELPEFWIDRTPVTNAEYVRFLAVTGYRSPKHWRGRIPPQEIADHPVTYVSWHDADTYAKWADKRLPTEQGWEKAARGTDGRRYPWGDQEPTPDLCNFERNVGSTTAVGHYSPQGDSPCGCVDMAGNVREWTASDHGSGDKVLRGGSWNTDRIGVRSADRWIIPDYSGDYWGFRCVGAATSISP